MVWESWNSFAMREYLAKGAKEIIGPDGNPEYLKM